MGSVRDGVRYLELSGELDLAAANELRAALDGRTQIERVVVDTTRLDFIDSAGLSVLVARREEFGQRFELVPGRVTSRLLDLTDLREFFDLP